jgi:hypothetical protein
MSVGNLNAERQALAQIKKRAQRLKQSPKIADECRVPKSIHVIRVWYCQCCAAPVKWDHVCACEKATPDADVGQ